jgi:hypothetical protein
MAVSEPNVLESSQPYFATQTRSEGVFMTSYSAAPAGFSEAIQVYVPGGGSLLSFVSGFWGAFNPRFDPQ